MNQVDTMEPGSLPLSQEAMPEWANLIQQQVQSVIQAALPHVIQEVVDQVGIRRPVSLGIDRGSQDVGGYNMIEGGVKESKVASPDRFYGKKGNEVYRWFAQLRLVFRGKPRSYQSETDKITYALSYMTGAAQNWAMPILQALDEGRKHDLLEDYSAFREAVISVYGDIDRRGNAEDRIAKLRQTGAVATYISSFNEYAAQLDWNESNLMARSEQD